MRSMSGSTNSTETVRSSSNPRLLACTLRRMMGWFSGSNWKMTGGVASRGSVLRIRSSCSRASSSTRRASVPGLSRMMMKALPFRALPSMNSTPSMEPTAASIGSTSNRRISSGATFRYPVEIATTGISNAGYSVTFRRARENSPNPITSNDNIVTVTGRFRMRSMIEYFICKRICFVNGIEAQTLNHAVDDIIQAGNDKKHEHRGEGQSTNDCSGHR